MDRLTRPGIDAEQTAVRFMDGEVKIQDIGDKLLDLILNGPTINGIKKDTLRHLVRQLYDALKLYEDTGGTPQDIRNLQDKYGIILDLNEKWAELGDYDHLRELIEADREGRIHILPCVVKPGDTLYILGYLDNLTNAEILGPRYVVRTTTERIYYKFDHTRDKSSILDVSWSDIGKNVFLSREEAEEALAKLKEAEQNE